MTDPIVERPDMANYGVPREPEGALPWAWARERLVGSRNYWVVTADAAARPHAMPVWGVWMPGDTFWFSCDHAARKARNLRANPRLTVAADSTAEVVSVEGVARAATEAETVAAGAAFIAKYGHEMGDMDTPAIEEFLRAHAAFTVTPERAFGMIETPEEFSTKATRWRWPG
jgi:hypothetical protein